MFDRTPNVPPIEDPVNVSMWSVGGLKVYGICCRSEVVEA